MSFKISIARPQVALHLRSKRLGAGTYRDAGTSESQAISKEISIQGVRNGGYKDRIRMIVFSQLHQLEDSKATRIQNMAVFTACQMYRTIVFLAKIVCARISMAVNLMRSHSQYPFLWTSVTTILYLFISTVIPSTALSLSYITIISASMVFARLVLAPTIASRLPVHQALQARDRLTRTAFRLAESCAAVQAYSSDRADRPIASLEEKAKAEHKELRCDARTASSSLDVVDIHLRSAMHPPRSLHGEADHEAGRPCPTTDDFLKLRLKFGARRSKVLCPEFDREGWLLVSKPNPELVKHNGNIYGGGWKSIAAR